MKKILYGFMTVLMLSACATEKSTETKVDGESKEESYSQEITDEERQKYNQLILDSKYEVVRDELYEIDMDKPLKDYYYLALAFIKKKEYLSQNYNENLDIDLDNYDKVEEFKKAYIEIEYILSNIGMVKEFPDDLKSEVDKLKYWADEKKTVFTPIYNEINKDREKLNAEIEANDRKKEFNEKVNNVTNNPQPVSIGMTKEEVLTEGWGRPKDINKTTTAYGTNEQWVYDGYRYLYFEDGVLTTIQD